jgi:TctA family transporter
VLGRITEKNLLLAMKLYGWSMFQRPLTLAMLVMILFILLYPVYQFIRRQRKACVFSRRSTYLHRRTLSPLGVTSRIDA